jgi:hypothetical protein
MSHNRLSFAPLDLEPAAAPAAVLSSSGFMVCPLFGPASGLVPPPYWQDVYRLAFEQARAVARPSWLERCYAVSLN